MVKVCLIALVALSIATGGSASERFHRHDKRVPNRYIVDVAVKNER